MALRACRAALEGGRFFPLFRPAMVTEFSRRGGEEGDRARMRLLTGFTYAVSLAAGVVVVIAQDYPGTTSTGRHVLTPVQTWMRGVYAGIVTGEWSPPPALEEGGGQGQAREEAAARGSSGRRPPRWRRGGREEKKPPPRMRRDRSDVHFR